MASIIDDRINRYLDNMIRQFLIKNTNPELWGKDEEKEVIIYIKKLFPIYENSLIEFRKFGLLGKKINKGMEYYIDFIEEKVLSKHIIIIDSVESVLIMKYVEGVIIPEIIKNNKVKLQIKL